MLSGTYVHYCCDSVTTIVLLIVSLSKAAVMGALLHMMPASARNADSVFPM